MNPDDLHVARRLRRADLPHLVAINDLRVALVLAVRRAAEVELDLFLADHDLRRAGGKTLPSYVPDALVRLRSPAVALGYAFEVDLGTESHRFIANRKIRSVERLVRSGKPCWGLLPWRPVFLTMTERRLRLLAPTFVRNGAGSLWLAGVLSTVKTRGALSNTFLTMDEIARQSTVAPLQFEHSLLHPPASNHPAVTGSRGC